MIVKSIGTVFVNLPYKRLKILRKLIIYYTQLKLKQSKNMKKLLLFAVAIIGFSAITFAQDTKTATASATIIGPISLTKVTDMNFGNIAVGTAAGTVVLSPAGTRNATNVTLPAVTGTFTAATFTVSGEGSRTYSITIPTTDHTIKNTTGTGGETMIVNAFTSTPTVAAGGTLNAGTQTLAIGATLNVSGSQAAGTYVSETAFPVTVNYN
jgi:hypothetical protein